MATFRSVKEYQAVMAKRAKRLRKESIKTASKTASLMQAEAIRLAPRKTGETIRGITKKKKKEANYIVMSDVTPKGQSRFKQNLWANQTAPHRSVRMWWGGGRKVIYGDGSHRTTGTPRFFHFATLRTKPKFSKLARKNIRNALRVKVG